MLKKILLLTAILVLAALFLSLPAWPGTLPVSIIPDGTGWVAHLDMEKFVATKLYGVLETDGRLRIKNRDITRLMKIDVFKDLTGLTVFGLEPGENRAVLAAAGRFDKARLLTLVELDEDHLEIPYGGNTIYQMDDDNFGAFVNDGLIVFAERREYIEKVLDTAAEKAKNFASSTLYAAFKDISAGAFASGIVEDIASLGREINRSRLIEKANRMFFSVQEKKDTLEIRAQVSTDTPESAKDIADIAQGLIAMARLGLGKDHQGERAASLLQGLQVKLEGKTVGLELNVPSAEFVDLMSLRHGFGGFFD